MTDAEALLWSLDTDPALRSSFVSVTFLDRPPDFARLRLRISDAVATTAALNRRVAPATFAHMGPRWEMDPSFDLDHHLRRIVRARPVGRREVLDLAAELYQEPFDRDRPLWQFTVVEGLEAGEAALIARMHHVISDGMGAVRLSATFLDSSPEADPIPRRPSVDAGPADGTARGLGEGGGVGRTLSLLRRAVGPAVTTNVDSTRRIVVGALGVLRHPERLPGQALDGVELARSMARQLAIVQPARSPLWTGRHSFAYHFETLSLELDAVRGAAKALGGTVNDVFVTAAAGAAGAYHRARGVDVGDLRMSMPVSTRTDRAVGGNAWMPTRVLVPAGEPDARKRFALVHQRLSVTKHEPSIGMGEGFAGLVRNLPRPVVVRLARQQVGTVDFACSNVRGAPFDLWIAGARVLSNHPMGPTAGTAFNATVLSYKDRLDIGLNTDVGAVDDPAELRDRLSDAFDELIAPPTRRRRKSSSR